MMDSFELTKIAAAVLSALLVIFGFKTAIELNQASHGHAQHAGYTLPLPEGGAAAPAAGGEAKAFDPAAIVAAVATADAKAGQDVFKKCSACHTIDPGGANKTGPNLHGVVGRAKGAGAGFTYSDAIKGAGGNWALSNLVSFVHDPKSYAKGNKMSFAGIKDPADLANLMAYLAAQK